MEHPVYSTALIARLVNGQLQGEGGINIEELAYDSRRIQHPKATLFFALKTAHSDGHQFILAAYKKGVRAFIVSVPVTLEEAAVILVTDTLTALQNLAVYHRSQFTLPVIGITGSNGKTVVKEWLYQLLEDEYRIVRSPKSFNSQIGVPLSVWEIQAHHTLGIFEAGISQPGEMQKLQQVIQPTIGIITNLGEAHNEGFQSDGEKLKEKLVLFSHVQLLIGPEELLDDFKGTKFTWSAAPEKATVKVKTILPGRTQTIIKINYAAQHHQLTIPFTDEASIQNAITCWCLLLYLKLPQELIQERFLTLLPVDMRLQLRHIINDCLLVNDSYSADTTSLKIALHFLAQQSAALKRTVILSDFFESGKSGDALYKEIALLLNDYRIEKLIAIGEKIGNSIRLYLSGEINLQSYPTTEAFIHRFRSSGFRDEIILLKGARKAGFERIAALFEQKVHGTVLQINLSAVAHNLKAYQKLLSPLTKVMAMVKAFSYGSGTAEIAAVLQFHNVAYLGVAYADEGVELVKAGIAIPVMVMNAEPSSFAALVENKLQPVIYSPALLHQFEKFIKEQGLANYPVHLEIETGMNRLGFAAEELETVGRHLASHSFLSVQSVFSHLAASEEAAQDGFTATQKRRFEEAVALLQQSIPYPFLKHIANSAAIVRHPELQFDMVRLGIGLYGIEPDADDRLDLQPVATLQATIAQIKEVKAGESVSYNRRGVVHRDSKIATVRIGYADGYSRRFSNGVGRMLVNNSLAPVIGSVCMDMTMLDITGIGGVKEGDAVTVFGNGLPVQQVATWMGTIPYEIMTSVSQRVKRVYYFE